MSIIDSAYVESACGEEQAKSVARSLLRERDAALLQIERLQILLNQSKHKIAEYIRWKDTPWCQEVDAAIEGKPFRRVGGV